MEIDKFLGLDCDLLTMGGYDVQKLAAQWESPFNMRKYDRVVMTADELNKMLATSYEKDEFGSELLKYPALQEFVMFVREPDLKMGTIICFRKTAMKHEIVDDQGDVCITYKPFIDAYIHFIGSPAPLDLVVTLLKATAWMKADNRSFNMSASKQMWIAGNSPVYQDSIMNEQTFVEFVRDIKLVYMTMQYCFKHRPVLFREITEKRLPMTTVPHGKKKKHKRKVRAVKVITIVPEELKSISVTTHEINCPCWGVMGHWRTYKSGKTIWIQPYKKGKERNKESAYQSKEYEISKEAEQHE